MAVTLKDVARVAGTSTAAVSATLNGTTGKSTRVGADAQARIRAAAEALGYVRNPIASSLATGRTGAIGFMLPYPSSFVEHDPFINNVMNGVVGEAVRQRYNITLYTATSEAEGEGAANVVDSRVDGLILVIPPPNSPIYQYCEGLGIAVVSVLHQPANETEWTVNSNDYEGGRLATQHLIDLGHRRIAHIEGEPKVSTSLPRRQGYMDALIEGGLVFRPELVVRGGFSRDGGADAAAKMLSMPAETRPSAVFCANDLCAHGVLQAATTMGFRVPDDLAVVGYDDTWYSTMTNPPLTTVNMAIEEMGARACRLLITQVEGRTTTERQPVLPVSLTVRESCGAARRHSSTEKRS